MSGVAGARSTVYAAIGLAVAALSVVGLGGVGRGPAEPVVIPSPSGTPSVSGGSASPSASVPAGPTLAAPCPPGSPGDVNGDGYAETVVGEPFDSPDQTGAVHVFYGTARGLVSDAVGTARDDQVLTQDTPGTAGFPGVPGASEPGDAFGFAALLADFNGDNCADLAVGVPGENANAGRVVVLYGTDAGIATEGVQSLTERVLLGAGAGQSDERFGDSLSSGDLDDDGIADLVVGAPGEKLGGGRMAGGVVVVYGATGGLGTGTVPAALVTQNSPRVPGVAEDGDGFGKATATGDINGDAVADLLVGVPDEEGSGVVQVLPGKAGVGVGALGAASYSQDTPGVPGRSEIGDRFGAAVAAGDVTGDAVADLAVGVPGENGGESGKPVPAPAGEGAVVFLPGSPAGLVGTGSQFWSQDSPGVEGVAGDHDNFGAALVMARLDNGALSDLAIGVPFDNVNTVVDAGAVNFLVGRPEGLSVAGDGGSRFHQASPSVVGAPEQGDQFGRSLAAPLVQSPDKSNLVIGVAAENLAADDTGLVHQLLLFQPGPDPSGSRVLHLDSLGVKGTPAGQDLFGFTLG